MGTGLGRVRAGDAGVWGGLVPWEGTRAGIPKGWWVLRECTLTPYRPGLADLAEVLSPKNRESDSPGWGWGRFILNSFHFMIWWPP